MISIWQYEALHITFKKTCFHTLYLLLNERCTAAKEIYSTTMYKHSPRLPWFTVCDSINRNCSITDKRTQFWCCHQILSHLRLYGEFFNLTYQWDLLLDSLPNGAGCSKKRQLVLVLSFNFLRLSCVQSIVFCIILKQHKENST